MSDETWRWNFIAVGNRETPQNHLKLIRQAVRWLAQEPSFEQVQIRPIPVSRPGEKIGIKLRVLKDDFTDPASRGATASHRPGREPSMVQTTADAEEGEYTGEYTPTREGSYRAEAEASLAGKNWVETRRRFSVPFPLRRPTTAGPVPNCSSRLPRPVRESISRSKTGTKDSCQESRRNGEPRTIANRRATANPALEHALAVRHHSGAFERRMVDASEMGLDLIAGFGFRLTRDSKDETLTG